MTFKGKISMVWYILTAILNGIAIAGVIYSGISGTMIFSLILLVIVDLYAIPVMFINKVIIGKKELVIQFGLLKKEIPFSQILTLKIMRDYSASFAADFDRIGIQARGMRDLFISVYDRDSLIEEIRKRNKKIKYVI